MACFTCKFWDRKATLNKNGQIRKGFLAACLVSISIPSNAPAAMQMARMNWSDGEGCPVWEQFDGPIELFTWSE